MLILNERDSTLTFPTSDTLQRRLSQDFAQSTDGMDYVSRVIGEVAYRLGGATLTEDTVNLYERTICSLQLDCEETQLAVSVLHAAKNYATYASPRSVSSLS